MIYQLATGKMARPCVCGHLVKEHRQHWRTNKPDSCKVLSCDCTAYQRKETAA